MYDVEIFKDLKTAKKEYVGYWGTTNIVLTKEQIEALLKGKCIASNDGEYRTLVSIGNPEE